MYQWQESSKSEKRNKLGGGTETVTTYSYSKVWSSRAIDSGNFKNPGGHQNPGSMRFGSEQWTTSQARLGAFRLPEAEVSRIQRWEDLTVTPAEDGALPDGAEAWNGGYYIGIDPDEPQIGDLRVRFSVVRPTEISIVAKQVSDTIEPYRTSNGGSIDLQEVGIQNAESMFQAAIAANQSLTWILRGVGLFLMFLGFRMVLAPLAVVADVVPLFGRIVGAGASAISFLLAMMLSMLTIAVAWIFYRPLLGIFLLALVAGTIFLIWKKMRGASPPPKPDLPPIPKT